MCKYVLIILIDSISAAINFNTLSQCVLVIARNLSMSSLEVILYDRL
jgi:hypothetical protein